ncbi:MAG TPA: dihydropteroate synthase [Jatrophihabitans sp.]|jgi:dihydropteroate synthase
MTVPTNADHLVVMGVLNVTPDSFSDGGRWADLDHAVEHGIAMHRAGADLVDVGGESTRPGAQRVDADEECRRVLPVLRALSAAGVPTSVDTYHAAVAAAALQAGASVVNDVSGGLGDPAMLAVVRDAGCPWILMHWRAHGATMQQFAHYEDVVREVQDELRARLDAAVDGGVAASALVIDPGLGFAKTAAHNWALLKALPQLVSLGPPVLVGSSRKSFLGSVLADADGKPRPVDEREDATTALTAYCALRGAWGVRVHEVRPAVDAARTIAAVQRG